MKTGIAFDDDGELVFTVGFPFPDDEPEQADEPERDATRLALEIILAGRTSGSIRLRAELLRHMAERCNPVETLGAIALRLKVSRRSLERTRAAILRHCRTLSLCKSPPSRRA